MYLYLSIINAAGLLIMFLDKQFAKLHTRRIPEAVLLGTALSGGSLGIFLGMTLFHHKTRKPKFYISVPLMLAAQCFLLLQYAG